MSQVVRSPISWHCSLQIPLLPFSAAQLLRFLQPPATLLHTVLGGGWGCHWPRTPQVARKCHEDSVLLQAVVQLQGKNSEWKRLHPVHPAGLEVCQSRSQVVV